MILLLGKGKGVQENQVVYLQYDTEALPLALAVYKSILEKGAYPMVKGIEESFQKTMFENASDDQLKFFQKNTQNLWSIQLITESI